MTSNSNELILDDMTFDRLVDGELSPSEYRRVLAALEEQPAAWRKCAEAFLQAQAWQRDMQDVRADAEAKPPVSASVEPVRRVSATQDWLRMALVAAASFLLAFVAAQTYWKVVGNGQVPREQPIAKSPEQHLSQPQLPPKTMSVATGNQPLGKVQLAVNRNAGEDPQIVDVPVYDPQAATEMLLTSQPALPDDLVQALEADGHRVNRQRQLVPVNLNDGRQMIVPVEGYRIVPVNRPSY